MNRLTLNFVARRVIVLLWIYAKWIYYRLPLGWINLLPKEIFPIKKAIYQTIYQNQYKGNIVQSKY